jgi:hypothetical protein
MHVEHGSMERRQTRRQTLRASRRCDARGAARAGAHRNVDGEVLVCKALAVFVDSSLP